jgi:hypothetical protein
MPKKNPHNPTHSPLLAELRCIEACAPEAAMPDAASLCLLRVVTGLDGPAWSSLSQSQGLGHWCAVPLGSPTPKAELLARALAQLASEATRSDPYTMLRTEIERSRSCNVPLALALIQPDLPRPGGLVLPGLLELVQGLKRSFDFAFALGDERLAVVFSGASLAEAERMVGAILRRIRTSAADKGSVPTEGLFCSAGLAGYGGCVEMTPEEFLASTGKALEKARTLGGNRLEVAAPLDVCLAPRDTLVHANEKHFLFTGKRAGDT